MQLSREEKATLIILATSALAIAALFIFSGNAQDGLPPYTNESRPGDIIRVDGVLLHKEMTGSGEHLILTVKSGYDIVKVFTPASSASYPSVKTAIDGDSVNIVGKVELYKGEREVVAD